jgi:hypothetical protein
MLPVFADEDNTRFFTPFALHNPQQLSDWMKNAGFKDVKIETITLSSGSTTVQHLETGVFRKHPLGKAVFDKDPPAFEGVAQKFGEGIVARWGEGDISFPLSALMTTGVK